MAANTPVTVKTGNGCLLQEKNDSGFNWDPESGKKKPSGNKVISVLQLRSEDVPRYDRHKLFYQYCHNRNKF